ncbi:hypothetical protein ERD78_11675 [Allopusillimonas soli]|uniref:Uncharacterized protein n=1 Tax=Allopusillimonas soli TaxID=659016 RepID=A0A853FC95_9BURK|nr:hypothetical protein [Allopusillimonas soli]NYT37388.1 hypothetical protein [Allopusillimonas soli]TEA74630.1 hypothetical protein ERD78_11675 [Allopusillimonas soli]
MDDVPEKTRRNLLVVSSALVLLWFLNAPLYGKATGLFDLSPGDAWRPWLAAVLVLAYFFLRFHTSPADAEERAAALRRYWQKIHKKKEIYIFSVSTAALARGSRPRILPFLDPKRAPHILVQCDLGRDSAGEVSDFRSNEVVVLWYRQPDTAHAQTNEVIKGNASLMFTDAVRIHYAVWSEGRFFWWPVLRWGVPYALSLAALAVCLGSIYGGLAIY